MKIELEAMSMALRDNGVEDDKKKANELLSWIKKNDDSPIEVYESKLNEMKMFNDFYTNKYKNNFDVYEFKQFITRNKLLEYTINMKVKYERVLQWITEHPKESYEVYQNKLTQLKNDK